MPTSYTAPPAPQPPTPPPAPTLHSTLGTSGIADKLRHIGVLVGCAAGVGLGIYLLAVGKRDGWLGDLEGWLLGGCLLAPLGLALLWAALPLWADLAILRHTARLLTLHLYLHDTYYSGFAEALDRWSRRHNAPPRKEPPIILRTGDGTSARYSPNLAEQPPAPPAAPVAAPPAWMPVARARLDVPRVTTVLPDGYTADMKALIETCMNGEPPSQRRLEARGVSRDAWKAAKDTLVAAGVLVADGQTHALAPGLHHPGNERTTTHRRAAARVNGQPPTGAAL